MRTILILLVLAGASTPVLADTAELQAAATTSIAAGDYEAAIETLGKALDVEPSSPYTHYLIAQAYIESEDNIGLAETHLDQAIELGAQAQLVALLRSRAYALTSRPALAIEQIESLAANGFAQYGRIDEEQDFAAIRDDARFQSALKTIRASRFPCEADERHHAFDFWIGDWTVTQNGQYAGDNLIQSILGECLIFEQWQSTTGGLGKSFNYYDPGKDQWRQIWVADSGTIIEFTGVARDGGIFFTAETVDPADASTTYHRFEFTQLEGGAVRQFWATSGDRNSWTTIWDGRYERK